jgi:hypothetical protein
LGAEGIVGHPGANDATWANGCERAGNVDGLERG